MFLMKAHQVEMSSFNLLKWEVAVHIGEEVANRMKNEPILIALAHEQAIVAPFATCTERAWWI